MKKNYLCTLKKIYIEEKRLERKPFNWRGKHGSIPEGVNVWLSVIGKIVTLNDVIYNIYNNLITN